MSAKVSINFIEGMGPKVGIDFKTGISSQVALIQKWELLSKLDVGTKGGIGLSQMRLNIGIVNQNDHVHWGLSSKVSLGPDMKATQCGVCQKIGIIYPKMGFYSKLSMWQKVHRCFINSYMP